MFIYLFGFFFLFLNRNAKRERERNTFSDIRFVLCFFFGRFAPADRQDGPAPILPRGIHHFPFKFQLPQSSLPCSFESKPGYVRYYIKVTNTKLTVIVIIVIVMPPGTDSAMGS